MKLPNEKIVEILIDKNYIDEADLKGFNSSGENSVVDFLLHKEVLNNNLVAQALAEYFQLPYINLEINTPTKAEVLLIPEDDAKEHRIVIVEEKEDLLVIATDDPDRAKTTPLSAPFIGGKAVELRYAASEPIDKLFRHYEEELGVRLETIFDQHDLSAPKLLEAIIAEAISLKASDIHFDPERKDVVVRFRIDGQLHDVTSIPKDKYSSLINKIKVEAKLRIDQHESALDGAMRHQIEDEYIDLRVSIIPTIKGEKCAVRILKRYVNAQSFESLGINPRNRAILLKAVASPHGMIVATGPTGSGKTTTLYALLRQLNKRNLNITTIEDPVEYSIKGINQIQVNPDTELTFAKGLRSIVRQDPDIIFVGEVRDLETSEIAINSALTGHLLLTSFHSNSASAAIPRFIDMGVEPFLLASTLEIVIAQRLVRKLCQGCRYSKSLTHSELEGYIGKLTSAFGDGDTNLYFSKGCEACNHTGYQGRIGLYEIIEIDKELRELISKSPTSDQVWEVAKKQGTPTMFDDGVEKVLAGITSIEEVQRVTSRV